jgi:hypothetical protein
MSAPHSTQHDGARSGRLPLLLFWAGVALAPLAALLLWFGSGGGPLKAAAVLAVGAAVLIGLSVVLRRDGESVRIELQETMVAELTAVRGEMHQLAAATDTESLRHQVGMLSGEVDALRQELVAVQDKQAAHAERATAPAAARPDRSDRADRAERPDWSERVDRADRAERSERAEPRQARVVADREPEVQLGTEPVAEAAFRDGRLVSAVAEPAPRRDRPTNVYRTETVQVTTHTTRVSEVAEPELVGASGGRTYGSPAGRDNLRDGLAGGGLRDGLAGGGNDRVDRWAERLGAGAERFGSAGERIAERIGSARAMRRDSDEDPLADLRATATPADLTGDADDPWNGLRSGDSDDPWNGLRPDDTFEPRRPNNHAAPAAPDFDAPAATYGTPAVTEYGARTPTEYGARTADRGARNGTEYGAARNGTEYGGDRGARNGAEYGSRHGGGYDGRGDQGGYDGDEGAPRVRAGRRRAELRVTDEWAEITPGRSGGRHGSSADLGGQVDSGWQRSSSLPGQPAYSGRAGHAVDDFDADPGTINLRGGGRDDEATDPGTINLRGHRGATGFDGGYQGGREPLAITQGDGQPRWSQVAGGEVAGRQRQGGGSSGREYGGGRERSGGRDLSDPYQSGSHAAPVSPAGRVEPRYGRDTADTHRVGAGGEYGSRHSHRDASYTDSPAGSWDGEESTGGWRSDGPSRHGAAEAAEQYRSAGVEPGRHQTGGPGGGEYRSGGGYRGGQYQGQPQGGGHYRSGDDERPSRHGRPETGRW